MPKAPHHNGTLPHRPTTAPGAAPTQRRVQVIDIPTDADDELASMASLVATLEALEPEARCRVLRWASGRYDPSPTLKLL